MRGDPSLLEPVRDLDGNGALGEGVGADRLALVALVHLGDSLHQPHKDLARLGLARVEQLVVTNLSTVALENEVKKKKK